MNNPIRRETYTDYKVEYFGSDFGYEPCWLTACLTQDYDLALVRYSELVGRGDYKVRLISQTISVDVLRENG